MNEFPGRPAPVRRFAGRTGLRNPAILAQTAAQAISQIKFDKVIVWDGGPQGPNGTGATANFMQSLARSLPPLTQIMRDIGGVDMPEYFAKLQPEGKGDPPSATSGGAA